MALSSINAWLFLILAGMALFPKSSQGQSFWEPSDTLHKPRIRGIAIGTSAAYGATLIGLNELWYANYPRSSFHFHDDFEDWQQMDKAGHIVASYYEGMAFMEMLKWAGLEDRKATWIGGSAGFILQSPIEILDGFSKEWGASPTDAAANAVGSGLLIGQELLWEEQKIRLKYSFSPTNYASKRPELLGSNTIEQIFKDYNGQTYWVSASMNDVIPGASGLPEWLNVSAGYSGKGMLGGSRNPAEYQDINRVRQYYLAPDINTAAINTHSGFLNRMLYVLSFLKVPMPTVEYNQADRFRFHFLFF